MSLVLYRPPPSRDCTPFEVASSMIRRSHKTEHGDDDDEQRKGGADAERKSCSDKRSQTEGDSSHDRTVPRSNALPKPSSRTRIPRHPSQRTRVCAIAKEGKSLHPAKLPKKRKINPQLPPVTATTNETTTKRLAPKRPCPKRRRCLPRSRPNLAPNAKPAAKPAAATRPIETMFPGKLFELTKACEMPRDKSNPGKDNPWTTSVSSVRKHHTGRILSWLVSLPNDTDSVAFAGFGEGFSLVVWEKNRFLDSPLVKRLFASLSTFRSFERQLNMWGFKRHLRLEEQFLKQRPTTTVTERLLNKESLRAYYHPCFQKGRPDLLEKVKRRPPGKGNKCIKETIRKSVLKPPPAPPVQGQSRVVASTTGTSDKTTEETMLRTVLNNTDSRKGKQRDLRASTGTPDKSTEEAMLGTVLNNAVSRKGKQRDLRASTPNDFRSRELTTNEAAASNPSPEPPPKENDLSEESSSSSEEEEEIIREDAPSIRTDLVLPSGACLRINRRIPAWAIPVQEAAIRYLYQKHSKLSQKASAKNGGTPFPGNQRETQTNGICPSKESSPFGSNQEPRNRTVRSETNNRSVVASKRQTLPFGSSGDRERRLGSLLQQSRGKEVNSRSADNSQNEQDNEDRFCDATEDEDEGAAIAPCGGEGFRPHENCEEEDDTDDEDENFLII